MNSQMKIATLAGALAALCSGAASAAIPAVTQSYHISGASAARAVTPSVVATFCVPGTIARYEYSVSPKDFNLTVCTFKGVVDGIPAALAGQSIAVYGRASGGSINGLKQILEPKFQRFLSPSNCPDKDASDASIQQCTTLTGADSNPVALPSGTAGNVSILGLTDEDPGFLGQVALEVDPANSAIPVTTFGADPLSVGERVVLNNYVAGIPGTFVAQPAYEIVWSVQAPVAFPLNNISSQSLRGLYTGAYNTLGQVLQANGVNSASTAGMRLCLRSNTSGTAAAHRFLWTGSGYCGTPGATTPVDANTSVGSGVPGYAVVLNNSSGNVESCLNVQTNAIGVNSLENSGLVGIKELSIDGVAPTLANAASGAYPWKHESTVNYNTNTVNATVAGTAWAAAVNTAIEAASGAGATGDANRAAFVNLFVSAIQNPAVINFGVSGLNGILALNSAGTPDAPFNPANPVSWTSKAGNNCVEMGETIFP